MIQGQTTVAGARAVLLRRGAQPDNEVWSTPVVMPGIPDKPGPAPDEYPLQVWAFNSDEPDRPDYDFTALEHPCQKFLWLRFTVPLVQGEQMTPLTRAAMAADATSALTHYGPGGLHFINADYTLALSRLPDGPFVGLAGLTHYSGGGVATMFDRHGPVGNSVTIGVANHGFPQASAAERTGSRTGRVGKPRNQGTLVFVRAMLVGAVAAAAVFGTHCSGRCSGHHDVAQWW